MQYRTVLKLVLPFVVLMILGIIVAQQTTPNAHANKQLRAADPEITIFAPLKINVGVEAVFSATVAGIDNPQFTWQFGDGGTESGNLVRYTYSKKGEYLITVFVPHDGKTLSKSLNVNVETIAETPTPAPGGLSFEVVRNALTVEEDEAIKFIATAKNSANAIFVWDFDDGTSAEGRVVSHSFKLPNNQQTAEYKVKVTLLTSDRQFIETSATQSVTIEEAPIRGLDFYAEQQPVQGAITKFVATKMSGSNVTYEWRFGDGSPPLNVKEPSKAFAQNGLHEVSLTARNSKGFTTVTYFYNVQLTQAPICISISNDGPHNPGDKVLLTALFANVDANDIRWDYGDGSASNREGIEDDRHTYNTSWKYPVIAYGSNSAGTTLCSTTVQITNELSPPKFLRSVPVNGLSSKTPFRAQTGKSYKFNVTNPDPASSYEWELRSTISKDRIRLSSAESTADIEFPKHDRYVLTVTKKTGGQADAQSDYVFIVNQRRGYIPIVVADGSLRSGSSPGSGPIITPTSVSESTPSSPNPTVQPPINTPLPTATPVTPEAQLTAQAQETQTAAAQTATAAAPTETPLPIPTASATMVLPTATLPPTATNPPIATATLTPVPTATDTAKPTETVPPTPTPTETSSGTVNLPPTEQPEE